MEWIKREDNRGFCLEAKFLTHRGVRRKLERSSFVRNPDDVDSAKETLKNSTVPILDHGNAMTCASIQLRFRLFSVSP